MNEKMFQLSGVSPPFFLLLTATFFLLAETALSIDELFQSCAPKNCGNGPTICFPFWIPGLQPPHCGIPNFQLSCKNDEPILQTQVAEFIIRDISYEEESLSVVNRQWVGNPCPYPANNLTFNSTPFAIDEANLNLLFFFNCTGSVPQEQGPSSYFPVSCFSNHSFAVLNSTGSLNYTNLPTSTCMPPISVPVARDSMAVHNHSQLLEKGFLLSYSAPNCSKCLETGGKCSYNETTSTFVCFCEDRPHRLSCDGRNSPVNIINSNKKKKIIIIGATATGAGVLFLACISAFLLAAIRRSSSASIFFWEEREVGTHKVEFFLQNYGSFSPKRYRFSDLKKMTNSFKDKLGQGGYGGVFKGKLDDGRLVAVKVLKNSRGRNGDEFINEVASIGRTYHVNVVPLLGFCSEGSKRALIYEYMPNGSLEKFIYSRKQGATQILEFEKLFQIAVGIARGLEYLHRGCCVRILHFDIKPHNILLDNDFCPKISDFGLAKLCPNPESTVSMPDPRGTIGYIAPEVFFRDIGGVSHKSDVYSYGMMVLEMVGGRKNVDARVQNSSEIYFPHWIYNRINLQESLEFLGITTQTEEKVARKMILVGLWCIQTDPSNRPSMSRVLEMLEGSLDCLQVPPKPYLSSPPRECQSSSTT